MGRVGYSSITLTDLTETIPVNLLLETNKEENIQVKIGSLYQPDFSKNEEELIITPSLFLGQQELINGEDYNFVMPNGRTDGYIFYQNGDLDSNGLEKKYYYGSSSIIDGIWVDEFGRLHYKKNLTRNIMIEAYIENFINKDHNYTIPLIKATNPINFLLLDGTEGNYSVIISAKDSKNKDITRQHFEDRDANPITLTAILYNGAEQVTLNNDDYTCNWYKLTDATNYPWKSGVFNCEITRDDVFSEEKIKCEILDKKTNLTYFSTIDIWDLKEDYDCQIIKSSEVYSESTEKLIFSANVYDSQGVLINSKDDSSGEKRGYSLTYQWGYTDLNGILHSLEETGDGSVSLEGNTLTIDLKLFTLNKQNFTFYCNVSNDGKRIVSEIETIHFVTERFEKISPSNIFVKTREDGSYNGNENYIYNFNFQLIDKEGNPIPYDTSDKITESIDGTVSYNDGTSINFSRFDSDQDKWNFTGTITFNLENENNLWKADADSRYYEFDYVYGGYTYSTGITIVKNVKGASTYNIVILSSSGSTLTYGDTDTTLSTYVYYGPQEIKAENLTYRWYKDDTLIENETKQELKVLTSTFSQKSTFSCEVLIDGNSLGKGTYTLVDQTDSLPVVLTLSTNWSQHIQTKTGEKIQPDCSEEKGYLIITPHLFIGNSSVNIPVKYSEEGNYIYYQIGEKNGQGEINYYYGSNNDPKIEVNKEGQLILKKNLNRNFTIEAYINNFRSEKTDKIVSKFVQASNPINILFLEEGLNNYNVLISSKDGRTFFTDSNPNSIRLNAELKKGKDTITNVSYSWNNLSEKEAVSNENFVTISRGDITGRDLYTCFITDEETGLVYSSSQLIQDFTDEYECRIVYNKPLLLNDKNQEVSLEAFLYNRTRDDGTEIVEYDGKELQYSWWILTAGNTEEVKISEANSKKYTVNISNDIIPKNTTFTISCKIQETLSEEEQKEKQPRTLGINFVTFQYSPVYSVKITPQNLFIKTDTEGKPLSDGFVEFIFELIDAKGQPLVYNTSDNINENIPSGDGIKFTQKNSNVWSFNGKINYTKETDIASSKTYEFSYVYFGQQFTEEVNLIAAFQGEKGKPGDSGISSYVIDFSNEFHAFAGGEGQALPDQSTECEVSAHLGNQPQVIEEIRIDGITGTPIYSKEVKGSYIKIGNNDDYLFIKAEQGSGNKIMLTIRTNNSKDINEKTLFLKSIKPLNFFIKIENTSSLWFSRTFSYTIIYQGKSYSLVPSSNVIKYAEAENKYDPSKITVSATVRQTTGEAVSYSEGKIIYSFDEINWKEYPNAGITYPNSFQFLYLRLYNSKASFSSSITETQIKDNENWLLDKETIPVLTSLEGYEIGGENLLRWTKDLPIENNKWSRNDNSNSYLTIEKDGDFSVLNYNVKDNAEWKNFKSPRTTLESEYIGKDFCFSCFVYSDNWSFMKESESTFHLGISAYKDIFSVGRDAYKNVGLFNHQGESSSNPIHYEGTWENGKWIKIWTTFSFDNLTGTDFDTNGDGEKNQNDKADPSFPHPDYKYFSFDLFLYKQGQLKIKKPKLELGKIPTAWSASPYDIDYTNIAGTNLIDDAKPVLTFSNSYRLNSSLFSKDNLYTLSWSQVSYSGNKPTLTWKINNSSTNTGSFSLINNFQYTFPKQNADWYLTLTVSEGEITFNELKIEKGAIATGYKITVEQANAIAEEQARNAALAEAEAVKNDLNSKVEELYRIPIIGGGEEVFSTKDEFLAAIQKYNEYDGRINTVAGDLEAQDTDILYSKEGIQRLEKSIQVVTSTTEPYIKIQADLQSASSSKTNFLKLTPERLEFWSGTASSQNVVAYMSNNLLVIKRGQLDEAIVKNYFNIGGLNFKITESGVGVIWDFNFIYSE